MKRNEIILWVDMLAGSMGNEPSAALAETFSIQTVRGDESLREKVGATQPLGLFYDCDYLDSRRLSLISEIKRAHRSIPFILITLQHSESLAVWAFRRGALDYLVKPVQLDELDNCIKRLEKIAESHRSQEQRNLFAAAIDIPQSIARSNQPAQDKLAPAIFYVQNHYNRRIYSDAVARLCGLSTTYFSKAFRKRFNMSFQEFLLRYRVAKACVMLGNPRANISDVCYSVGFRDPSYFTRVFKRYVGVSPSDFDFSAGQNNIPYHSLETIDESSSSTSSSQVVRALAGQFGQ